jgi:hypothetical protein
MHDSARWEDFRFRPGGDLVITTPAKCGTTWMQTICGLLIFQDPVVSKYERVPALCRLSVVEVEKPSEP